MLLKLSRQLSSHATVTVAATPGFALANGRLSGGSSQQAPNGPGLAGHNPLDAATDAASAAHHFLSAELPWRTEISQGQIAPGRLTWTPLVRDQRHRDAMAIASAMRQIAKTAIDRESPVAKQFDEAGTGQFYRMHSIRCGSVQIDRQQELATLAKITMNMLNNCPRIIGMVEDIDADNQISCPVELVDSLFR